jgi:uncharacterized protein YndB with AHSA1/START domain
MAVSNAKASAASNPLERETTLTRVFDAPRRLVFEAWTKPEHVVRWFGPQGFTLDICEIDLRPGGAWRYVMRKPKGRPVGMRGVFQEIAAPEWLVSTESFDDYPGESLNTVTLVEQDGQTTYTNRVVYSSREIRDAVIKSGMEIGARETFDRLAGYLANLKGEHQ